MALNSSSVIKIIDLLCEGPIQGLVNGKQGIFLNDTPVADNKGNLNFPKSEVNYNERTGVKDQKVLSGWNKTASGGPAGNSTVIDISQEIGENYSENLSNKGRRKGLPKYGGGSHIFQITDEDTDSFELLFTIPQLFCTGMEGIAKGQLFNATIRLRVFVKNKNSKFKKVVSENITGISTSNYQFKTKTITLTGKPPYTVKVVKFVQKGFSDGNKKKRPRAEQDYEVKFFDFKDIPTDTTLANTRANRLILTSLIERQDIRTAYPFTACVALKLSTQAFSSLPTRKYLVQGMKVRIPHNATAEANGRLTFQGSFQNKFKSKKFWTTCPVCIFYDLLVNKRFGCGEFIDKANLNWVDLYPLSRYANQLVSTPDGKEPRFAINTVIGSQAEAYKVLQNLASIFRGMTYWGSNTINVVADHGVSANISSSNKAHTSNVDQDPVHLYTNSNVIGGGFGYSGSSIKTRSTSIWVSYNDPDNFYKPNVVVVEDYDLIEKYGYNIKEIIAFGCSSKYQAQRMGQWMLNSEKLDGHTVTFQTGLDGLAVLPGQIFAVQDEMRAGTRLSGRIKSATSLENILPDTNYHSSLGGNPNADISVTLGNGTVEKKEIKSINSSGVINVKGSFTSNALANSIYVIERPTVQAQKFKCIDVKDNGNGKYTITGLQFNDSIYDVADNTVNTKAKLDYEDVTTFNNKPTIPTDLQVSNALIQQQTQSQIRAIFTWSRGINAANVSFRVKYNIGDPSLGKTTILTDQTRVEVDNVPENKKIHFRVQALSFDSGKEKFSPMAVAPSFTIDSLKTLKSVNVPDPQP